jgi:hypothetical protein
MPVNFKVPKGDLVKINKIADRAMREVFYFTGDWDQDGIVKMRVLMDLTATHAVNPLRLDEFLAAPRYDFLHDIDGITRHIDRTTGMLDGGFSPRYSA